MTDVDVSFFKFETLHLILKFPKPSSLLALFPPSTAHVSPWMPSTLASAPLDPFCSRRQQKLFVSPVVAQASICGGSWMNYNSFIMPYKAALLAGPLEMA